MPEFVVVCRDKPDSSALRAQTRPAHLEFIDANKAMVRLAGPLLSDEDAPIGSLFILSAESRGPIEDFVAQDPYAKAGLFAETEIHAFRIVVGN